MTAEYPQVESKFYLDMPLPYEVNESSGNAKFDKACICMSRWLSKHLAPLVFHQLLF